MSEKFSVKWQDFLKMKKDLEDEEEMDDLDLVKEALFKLVNASNDDDVKEFTEDENCDEKKTKVGKSNLWLQRQKLENGNGKNGKLSNVEVLTALKTWIVKYAR